MSNIQYKTVQVGLLNIFYRDAGSPTLPGLLLLHGHSSASHAFRNILPQLSEMFHVVAPDYPGFGNSTRPHPEEYAYTFANLSNTIDKFTEQIGLTKFSIYLLDFGAPIGLTLAAKHPERITGLFTQSSNSYFEGVALFFDDVRAFWANRDDSDTRKAAIEHMFSIKGIEWAYKAGVSPASRIGFDAIALDIYYTYVYPGTLETRLALMRDHENNVKTYPEWQAYLRKYKPKVVGVSGKRDPFFRPRRGDAFKLDVPDADISFIDGGHYLIESHPEEIVTALKKLL